MRPKRYSNMSKSFERFEPEFYFVSKDPDTGNRSAQVVVSPPRETTLPESFKKYIVFVERERLQSIEVLARDKTDAIVKAKKQMR